MEQINVDSSKFVICPKFEKAFSILGKKWNGLILDVLVEAGPQRFVSIAKQIPEVSDRVLVERLRELTKENIVAKDGNLYTLTDKGLDLERCLDQVKQWSENWIREDECK